MVPAGWLEASVRTNPDIVRSGQEVDRKYGSWINDCGQLWPELPRDGFTASEAGGHYASAFPALRLVVVQNPGPYDSDNWGAPARANPELLAMLLGATV